MVPYSLIFEHLKKKKKEKRLRMHTINASNTYQNITHFTIPQLILFCYTINQQIIDFLQCLDWLMFGKCYIIYIKTSFDRFLLIPFPS